MTLAINVLLLAVVMAVIIAASILWASPKPPRPGVGFPSPDKDSSSDTSDNSIPKH